MSVIGQLFQLQVEQEIILTCCCLCSCYRHCESYIVFNLSLLLGI